MAHYRTNPSNRVRRELSWLRTMAATVVTVLASLGLTNAAVAPDTGLPAGTAVAARSAPLLSQVGEDLIITGSIDHLFEGQSFVGTNRALKTDRARPVVEALALSTGFEGIRQRIAALRQPKLPAPVAVPVEAAGLPVAVAAIDPALTTPALDAIDALAGTADGVPLPRTMSSKLAYARADLPATVFDGSVRNKAGKKVSDKEVWCMATAIYFEARSESYRGQVAVGQVVMNRVAHRLYPDTICGVVFQNQNKRNACQFSFACDGIPERVTEQKAWDQAMIIAKDVIAGKEYLTEVGYSTHYHATYVYPHWAPRMKKNTKIGLHVFYQFKRGWKFG